jgi:hypothetical protein
MKMMMIKKSDDKHVKLNSDSELSDFDLENSAFTLQQVLVTLTYPTIQDL